MVETKIPVSPDMSEEGQMIADEVLDLTKSSETDERKLTVAQALVGLTDELSPEDRAMLGISLGRRDEFVQMARNYSFLKPVEAYLTREEDQRWGDGLIEIGREDLPRALKRLGEGRNPAVVVRAGEWQNNRNFLDQISQELSLVGDFTYMKSQKYPELKWRSGSSLLHLDKFPTLPDPQFKWSLTASQLEKGRALAVVGLATNKQRNLHAVDVPDSTDFEGEYGLEAEAMMESEPVKKLFQHASEARPPMHWERTIRGTHLTAVTLNPHDAIIWPQGGPYSKLPAWHCLRQVGSEPRESVSYHFIQQD